jgi:alkanesulfonate monooxygenase SsuD/methylene tetrahydromethanopterin reductase-like flavin-dependent oxidoreductase (luciferase family)
MIQLGWKAGTEQYPPDELLDYAIAAEEAGFDSIDASDHFHPWSERGQACFVWTWLGAVAAKTSKITLGTGVTCPILRYRPAVIAQAATFAPALFTQRIYTPKMAEENGRVVGSDTIRKSVCISTDPEDHIEFARQYADLGFDQLFFHSAGPDQRAFIEGYGRDVLPQLRQALQPKSRPAAK